MCIAAIWSEISDFGQNSDQTAHFGQKKVRILDLSQKFWKVGQKTPIFLKKLNFDEKKN